jgi:hypothetical protein
MSDHPDEHMAAKRTGARSLRAANSPVAGQGSRDHVMLSRLVGHWQGTLRHRGAPDQPFVEMAGTLENRWVHGGQFVEMTFGGGAGGDGFSAVFYIGHERTERRHVLVSLAPGDRRVTTRLGEWTWDGNRLIMMSEQSRALCDMAAPGRLAIELSEEIEPGHVFTRFRADYRPAVSPPAAGRPADRPQRRFVIA